MILTKFARPWSLSKFRRAALATMFVAPLSAVLLAPNVANAKTPANIFAFKGAYSGSVKLSPSSDNCLFSKSYDGKSFIATLSKMKGTIKGLGTGSWAVTFHIPKLGTNHLAKVSPQTYGDSSFQNNSYPYTAFVVTSGTVTDNGFTGSFSVTVIHHIIGSQIYKGIDTVSGSWNCPQGLNQD